MSLGCISHISVRTDIVLTVNIVVKSLRYSALNSNRIHTLLETGMDYFEYIEKGLDRHIVCVDLFTDLDLIVFLFYQKSLRTSFLDATCLMYIMELSRSTFRKKLPRR